MIEGRLLQARVLAVSKSSKKSSADGGHTSIVERSDDREFPLPRGLRRTGSLRAPGEHHDENAQRGQREGADDLSGDTLE